MWSGWSLTSEPICEVPSFTGRAMPTDKSLNGSFILSDVARQKNILKTKKLEGRKKKSDLS